MDIKKSQKINQITFEEDLTTKRHPPCMQNRYDVAVGIRFGVGGLPNYDATLYSTHPKQSLRIA